MANPIAATTLTDELNRVQFIAEDFATYRSEANNFYATYYPQDFNNLIATDLGNALMDQLAFAMQSLSFMINRRASELFLATARLNSSVVKIAQMLGYPIAPAKPANTTLTITFPGAPFATPISIPTGFQFQGPGSVIYEYANSVPAVLAVGQNSITIPIREGTTQQVSFSSDGTANQTFNIYGVLSTNYLYSDQLQVTVDGVAWTNLDLLQYQATNTYQVVYTASPPQLVFGDGIVGNIPPLNASIVMAYRSGQGLGGTIGQNQISGQVKQLVVNGVPINMSFTNTVANAGANPETIEHVKAFASSFFRTQNAAVIKSDYDTIASLQDNVALADAQIIRGIDNDITIQAEFNAIAVGESILLESVSGMAIAGVTGQFYLGVAGVSGLYITGQDQLGVSGQSVLGVSGITYLGTDVSGNVTGVDFLGVSGMFGLGVVGVSGLMITGPEGSVSGSLSVSGTSFLGVSGQSILVPLGVSGVGIINEAVSGLAAYLSQAFSDTSQANQVQVVVLATDINNDYISPTTETLTDVQNTLQSLADAVVTVVAVDGISRVIDVDVLVELGISSTAVQTDVVTRTTQALVSSTAPLGLLKKRSANVSLYKSDIQTAVENANNVGDIVYMNVVIEDPTNYLDNRGNFIIGVQQIIQAGVVTVNVIEIVPATVTMA
jgi:hypothetical protein